MSSAPTRSQQTARSPNAATVGTLTELLREAEERQGNYEATAPKHHWSGWYAAYIVARQRGSTSDEAAADATRHLEEARAGV